MTELGSEIGRPLRIAFLHPTYWPEVRRGSERLIHDLGVTLTARGHEITLLTTHEGGHQTGLEDGLRIDRARRLPSFPPLTWYEDFVVNIPVNVWRLARGNFDLAHAFFPSDGWAAVSARRLGGPPVVATTHGIPMREYIVARRYRIEMMRKAMNGAEVSSVLSEVARAAAQRYLLADPIVLPGGVRVEDFNVSVDRAAAPTLFCASSIGDPRKRGALLLEAFARVRESIGDAELLLARTPDPFMSPDRHELPDGARWVEVEGTSDLAALYATSWATVLPAIWEPFGLVLLESMAAGTPVIAARSGAGPELVDGLPAGRLFEEDDADSLTEAMLQALRAAPDGATASSCRALAADHDWERVADRYEAAYTLALNRRGSQ